MVAGKAAAVDGGKRDTRNLKRGHYFSQIDRISISFIFTNFPKNTIVYELWKVFAKFGPVGEVFVPHKLDRWGRCFGFMKFKQVENLEVLERRLEETTLGESRMKVNKSRFERDENFSRGLKKKEVRRQDRGVFPSMGIGTSSVKKGSLFKDVFRGKPWQRTVENNQRPSLEVQPSPDRMIELESCYVGVLAFFQETLVLQNNLILEGLKEIKVTTMGDNLVLLQSAIPGPSKGG